MKTNLPKNEPSAGARRRRGFLSTEAVIALGVLAAAGVGVAQLATWVLVERGRLEARLEATEAAANVLEQARSLDWNDLTPQWSAEQKLTAEAAARLPDAALTAKVVPEPQQPRVKRVTVEVRWHGEAEKRERPVTLTTLFAAREQGGKP